MNDMKMVQHFSGKGRIFKVTDDSMFCWRIYIGDLEQETWVPKSEYIIVDVEKKI